MYIFLYHYCLHFRVDVEFFNPLNYIFSPQDLRHYITFNVSLVPRPLIFSCGFINGNDILEAPFNSVQTAVRLQRGTVVHASCYIVYT